MEQVGWWLMGGAVLYVLIFVSGYRLKAKGKPYALALSTLHKLASLAAVVALAVALAQAGRVAPLDTRVWVAAVQTGVLFVATMGTGGVLTLPKAAPAAVGRLHRLLPFLTVLSSVVAFSLLLAR